MSTKVHKPGPFKQQNKTHKTGKHLSKGTLSSVRKGIGKYFMHPICYEIRTWATTW